MSEAPLQRILMTADAMGGVFTYATLLAGVLGDLGVEVTLATMGEPLSSAQRALVARLPSVELVESRFRLEWMEDPWADVGRAGEWLLALEQRTRAEVVHLNGYCHAPLPFRAPKVVVAHSCVLSWWRAVHGGDAPAWFNRYRIRVRDGIHAANTVVAPSQSMLDSVICHYGRPRRAEVIPNASDPAVFSPGAKEAGYSSGGRLWDAAKNIGAVLRIAPRLPWPVVITGPTEFTDIHVTGAHPALTTKNVHFLGPVDLETVATWLARASIYVLPARYEPFGLSALEAGLAECALVLGDIPSLREIWGDAAVYVNPEDDSALESAVLRLAADEALRARIGRAARRRALLHAPMQMGHAYRALYSDLRDGRGQADVELRSCD